MQVIFQHFVEELLALVGVLGLPGLFPEDPGEQRVGDQVAGARSRP